MNCNQEYNCIPYEEYIKVDRLARAFVPFQYLCSIYDMDEGLIKGTIFPELASPYCKGDSNLMKEENPCCNMNRPTPFSLMR